MRGIVSLILAASAVLVAGSPAYSLDPVVLTSGHADVGIAYEDGAWNLHVHDEMADREYAPAEVVLRVPNAAKMTAPADPAFAPCLGPSGSPVWILPQVEASGILFLGYATEEIVAGVFAGDRITWSLRSKSGPGNFCLYRTGSTGEPIILMNSADGFTAADSLQVPVGTHGHANWTFTAPGTYQIGFEASGTLVAGNRMTSSGTVLYTFQVGDAPTPTLNAPPPAAQLTTMGPLLSWTNPPGTKWFQVQVIPSNNDGPGIDLVMGDTTAVQAAQYQVMAPDFGSSSPNYVMLPGMTYSWRVRTASATGSPAEADWGAWATSTFKTPTASSSTIRLAQPAAGGTVSGRTPTLTWENSDKTVFYYEVQVSKDSAFGHGSFLYWELVHGGASTPPNSYAVPAKYPLEAGATYYWRVRPRVQGDGTAAAWSASSRFEVP